jgi:hypothetical protein
MRRYEQMLTITTVKVVADLLTPSGVNYEALLNMTIRIENGMLTIGSLNGPDMWRAPLKDISYKEAPNG